MNKNLYETHRYIYEHDIENNQDALKIVTEEFPDGHDDDEKNTRELKKTVIHRVITENERETNWYNFGKGNRIMPRWHNPRWYGGMCTKWTWQK